MAKYRAIGTVAALGLGLAAAAAFVPDDKDPNLTSDASQLFDPLYIGARACGPAGVDQAGRFARLIQAFTVRGAHAAADPGKAPPLWENLGTVSLAVSTAKRKAQRYFDQGLRLTYGFNHAEAVRAFRQAQTIDPQCAMCYWGEALALGPNINAPMEEGANALALVALDKAKANAAGASAKEQALIGALATRYSSGAGPDNAAYAAAMTKVHADFPEDHNIASLYAESLMDTQPWDYWESDFTTPKGNTARVLAAIEGVLAADPNHPGAIHLYIHITEASTDPYRAESFADRLGAQMPGSGHLVHMPSHTYYRIGRFIDSLNANIVAAKADEDYIAQTGATGIYPFAYYPHNVHFIMTSALMAGDGTNAISAAEKLDALIPATTLKTVPWTQPIKAAPLLTHAQFSAPETILALREPDDAFPYVKAAWHYARGVAYAAQGNGDAAQVEAQAIEMLGASADFEFLHAGGVPAGDILKIEENLVHGRAAQARGDYQSAVAAFEKAHALEVALPYTEPPYWYYPTGQTLGAALLQAGKADEAARVLRQSLIRVPNNGWALYGLMEAYRASGDDFAASHTRELLSRAWAGDPALLSLGRL